MIANLSKIRGFRASARYLLHGDRETPGAGERPEVGQRPEAGERFGDQEMGGDAQPTRVLWTRSYGGASEDVMTAAAEMADLGRYNPRVQVPGYHLVLSFDPEDEVGRAEMLYVRDQIHRALEFPDLLSVVVAHGDAYYPHWHELICRVDYWSGKAVDPSFSYVTIERRLRELEREMGLRETPGRHGRLPGQSGPDGRFRPQFDSRWLGAEDRSAARRVLRTARSWAELEERLAGRDLVPRLGRKNLVLARGEERIRAGSLARGTSLMKMERRMGETFEAYVRSKGTGRRDAVKMDVPVEGAARSERAVETAPPEPRLTAPIEAAPEPRHVERTPDTARPAAPSQTHLDQTPPDQTHLEERLARVYRDPIRVKEKIRALLVQEGVRSMRDVLLRTPERLGPLTRLGRSRRGALLLYEIRRVATADWKALGGDGHRTREIATEAEDPPFREDQPSRTTMSNRDEGEPVPTVETEGPPPSSAASPPSPHPGDLDHPGNPDRPGDPDPPLRPDLQALMEEMQIYDLGEELLDVEAEIRRLQDYTLPVLKDEQRAIRRGYAEVTHLFDRAYVDGDLARSRFDQAAVLEGIDAATRRLEDAPESYGELRGGGLFQFRERRERGEALAALPGSAGSHHEALRTVERTFGPPPGSAPPVPPEGAVPRRAPADDLLGARLADLYENPAAARQRFEAVCRRLGTEAAAVGLNRHPEGVGRLRRDVAASPRLRAESAYATAIAAIERADQAEGPGRGTLLDEALGEETERLRALQEDRADLRKRIHNRIEASPHLRGLDPVDLERLLEARLRALSAADRGRVVRALEDRLRRQAAVPGRAERVARHRPHPHQRMGTGLRSAAYSLALQASSRALGRGADEIMGRDTFS